MARKKKQIWDIGDFFTVPLADGSFSLGQVVGREPDAMNSAICAFFARSYDVFPEGVDDLPIASELVSMLFVTRDLLDSGDWKVFAKGETFDAAPYIDITTLRECGFVGIRIIGSGIVIKLMGAFYGLLPWNGFYEPDYLDRLLVSPDKKPLKVVLK